jgi:hypothetical protein
VLDDLFALVLRTRSPEHPSSIQGLRAWLGDRLDQAVWHERFADRAFLVWGPRRESIPPSQRAVIALDLSDGEAAAWMAEALASLPGLDSAFTADLDPAYSPLLSLLEPRGFRAVRFRLEGQVTTALEALDRRSPAAPAGFTVRPMRAEDIPEVLAQRRRAARADPSLGHPRALDGTSAGDAAIDAALRDQLLRQLGSSRTSSRSPSQLVLIRSDRIVGSVGFVPVEGGRGIDLLVVPEMRGRGLAWLAYRHLLLAMRRHGVSRFDGETSSPAVVHISRQLGRRVSSIELGYRAPGSR